jgi:hypothetical protein
LFWGDNGSEMAMELVKASDLSAVVHKAVENLQELGKTRILLLKY